MSIHNFSLSLIGTAFSWYSSLQSCSIGSWAQLEEKFHKHFYNGTSELKLSNLISVKQRRDKSVLDFVKRFRDFKKRCFKMIISEKILLIQLLLACALILKKS